MSNYETNVRMILVRYLSRVANDMIEHDGMPDTRERYLTEFTDDLMSELRPFLDLPLLWRPMLELKGAARMILTAAPDALTRCHHYNPNASKIKRPGFQPTHFCEVPPGAPNATGY
jgi:hypothetical protein